MRGRDQRCRRPQAAAQLTDAIAVYEELIKQFAGSTDPAIREHVASAPKDKDVKLGKLNRPGEVAVHDELREMFRERR